MTLNEMRKQYVSLKLVHEELDNFVKQIGKSKIKKAYKRLYKNSLLILDYMDKDYNIKHITVKDSNGKLEKVDIIQEYLDIKKSGRLLLFKVGAVYRLKCLKVMLSYYEQYLRKFFKISQKEQTKEVYKKIDFVKETEYFNYVQKLVEGKLIGVDDV